MRITKPSPQKRKESHKLCQNLERRGTDDSFRTSGRARRFSDQSLEQIPCPESQNFFQIVWTSAECSAGGETKKFSSTNRINDLVLFFGGGRALL